MLLFSQTGKKKIILFEIKLHQMQKYSKEVPNSGRKRTVSPTILVQQLTLGFVLLPLSGLSSNNN